MPSYLLNSLRFVCKIFYDIRKPHIFLLWFVLLIPVFPQILSSEQHVILFPAIFCSIFLIFFSPMKLSKECLLFGFLFLVLQMLLLISWAFDIGVNKASMADIPSLIRPIFFIITTFFFYNYFSIYNKNLFGDLYRLFVGQVFIICVYYLAYKLSPSFREIAFILYLRSGKTVIHGYATTFFKTTYFAAYYYFIPFLFFLVTFFIRRKLIDLCFVIMSGFLLVFAGSKSFYIVPLIAVSIIFLFSRKGRISYLFLFTGSWIVITITLLFRDSLIEIISRYHSLRSLSRIIGSPGESLTLQLRLAQTFESLNNSIENWGFGVGLGRGILLESYLANFTYRYGLIGLIIYHLIFLGMAYLSLKIIRRNSFKDKVFGCMTGIWFLLLPFAMLSSAMIERSKMSIISFMVFGLVLSLYQQTSKGSGYLE